MAATKVSEQATSLNDSSVRPLEPVLPAAPGEGGGGGQGGGNGGGNGGGGGGGKPVTGDLYGDQYVMLRDLDPTGGGGDGEPVLDANGQPILIGTNGEPIYFVAGPEGDYEIPAEDLVYVQTVELERANVARAPSKVMEKSLDEALGKIEAAEAVTTDAAGRIVCDGVAIDSPLENLALYQYLMSAGGKSGWPDVTDAWPDKLASLLGTDTLDPDWDPSSLLGAAFSKEDTITLDAVLYENSILGVNGVGRVGDETIIDYFDFSGAAGETYTYDRAAQFEGVWLRWYENTDEDSELELVEGTLLSAVFGGEDWSDLYMEVSADGSAFAEVSAERGGVNDFAQATDDARAVIYFMHEHYGAEEFDPYAPASDVPESVPASAAVSIGQRAAVMADEGHDEEPELIIGTNQSDVIDTGGGPQHIIAGNGDDDVSAGGGPDIVEGGNDKDVLIGGGGPDDLAGDNGKDVITGGAGPDTLTGGNAADTFVYQFVGDAPAHGGGEDHDEGGHEDGGHEDGGHDEGGPRVETITDFDAGLDRIDFTAFGTIVGFSGNGPMANSVWALQSGDDTVLNVDLNGDVSGGDGDVSGGHPAEMSILLIGVDAGSVSVDDFAF